VEYVPNSLGQLVVPSCKSSHIEKPNNGNWLEGIKIDPQNRGIENPYLAKVWFEDDPFIPACCLE
jgi:hypothetical protein